MARDIANEVRRVIHEHLDVDDGAIKPESTIVEDLGADSLAVVELVLKLEETFGISIAEEDTDKLRTVQDAIDYIDKQLAAA